MSTRIEWTDRTWNPAVGCEAVSPGCDRCYAATVASRGLTEAHRGLTDGRQWNGTVRTLPDRLGEPTRWRKPSRVFVGSMTDLFHPDVSDQYLLAVWRTMGACSAEGVRMGGGAAAHTFQVLTKRPGRARQFLNDNEWLGYAAFSPTRPLPNVWIGTSIESDRYTWRADHLRGTPAAVRFLSLEPLLGPLPSLDLTGIDWVIVGGESGPGARPVHPDWARDIRDRCISAGIPFFFKQWGSWAPGGDGIEVGRWVNPVDGATRGTRISETDVLMTQFPKKAAGRLLDGRTWDEYPA